MTHNAKQLRVVGSLITVSARCSTDPGRKKLSSCEEDPVDRKSVV